MAFREVLVRVLSFPPVMPQERRTAAAPAVMAAATEEPVRHVRTGVFVSASFSVCMAGPWTRTPGAARSGFICPSLV